MGLLAMLADFIGGKDAKIFDENGRVRHQFPEKKWIDWNNRFRSDGRYDWRNHGAQERISKPKNEKPKSN